MYICGSIQRPPPIIPVPSLILWPHLRPAPNLILEFSASTFLGPTVFPGRIPDTIPTIPKHCLRPKGISPNHNINMDQTDISKNASKTVFY